MNPERPTIFQQIRQLDLPRTEFMVMGSGILEALRIRDANDIDMVVSERLYNELEGQDWHQQTASTGQSSLAWGNVQAYASWKDSDGQEKTLEQLIKEAWWVNGVAFASLGSVIAAKRWRGLDKDLADLELIAAHIAKRR